ncbi:MAG: methyltransferase domain-containing protein [Anaerolineae bacterium]|nr:methyltransferase domain-containing protein [Anaerolineae bacterium]
MTRQVYTQAFFSSFKNDALQSAEVIVPIIDNLVHPRSVVDIGCGVGTWLSVFKKHGVSKILGIDGDYIVRDEMLIRADEFVAVDLSVPLHIEGLFDLALCLEVAEHLPKRHAHELVNSLTRLSPIVFFSAAAPGQGGVQHLNEQWPEYWERLFLNAGYLALDPVRPWVWQDHRVAWYYRQNSFLYARTDLVESVDSLSVLASKHVQNDLLLIHKRVLAANLSLTFSLKRIPNLLAEVVLRYLKK